MRAKRRNKRMNYKVGDKVRVSTDLTMAEFTGDGTGVVDEMLAFRGQTLTIKSIRYYPNSDKIKNYSVIENQWFWSNEMFERCVNVFTKQDLKAGMVLEDEKKQHWLVVNTQDRLGALEIFGGKLTQSTIDFDVALNDDLTHKTNGLNPSGNILKVYDMPKFTHSYIRLNWFVDTTPLWERNKVLLPITKEALADMGFELINKEPTYETLDELVERLGLTPCQGEICCGRHLNKEGFSWVGVDLDGNYITAKDEFNSSRFSKVYKVRY